MPFLTTDLAHTADINPLDMSCLCLAHHPAVSGAAQPAVVNVISPPNYFGTIALRLQHQNIQGVFAFYIVAGDARIQPRALGFLCCFHGFLFPLFCFGLFGDDKPSAIVGNVVAGGKREQLVAVLS